MGDMITSINEEIETYKALCEKYGESVQMDVDGFPDCFGEHARKLKEVTEVINTWLETK